METGIYAGNEDVSRTYGDTPAAAEELAKVEEQVKAACGGTDPHDDAHGEAQPSPEETAGSRDDTEEPSNEVGQPETERAAEGAEPERSQELEEILNDEGKPVEDELKAKMSRCFRGGKAIVGHVAKTHLELRWSQGRYLNKIHKHLREAKCFETFMKRVYQKSRQHGYNLMNLGTEFDRKDMRTYADNGIGEKKLLACIRAKKHGTKEWVDAHLEEIKDTKPEAIRDIEGADRRNDTRRRYEAFDPIIQDGQYTCKVHKKQSYAMVCGLKTKDDKDSFVEMYKEWVKTRPGSQNVPPDPDEDASTPPPDSPPITNLLELYPDGLDGRFAEMTVYYKAGSNKTKRPIRFEAEEIPVDIASWNAAWLPYYVADLDVMIGARLDDGEGNTLWLTSINEDTVTTKLQGHVMEDDPIDLNSEVDIPIRLECGIAGEYDETAAIEPGQPWEDVARGILENEPEATSVSLMDSRGKKVKTFKREEDDAEDMD